MPNTSPWVRKKRQSASFWFQCASVESRSPAGASSGPSRTISACSIAAIAHLVFGGLAVARHRARDPVRCPVDQLLGIDDRQAEHPDGLRSIGEPGRRLFAAGDNGFAAEPRADLCREIAHGQYLMAADIDRRGRRVAMCEATQRLRGGIALPDEIDMAEADVDRLALDDLGGDVVQ